MAIINATLRSRQRTQVPGLASDADSTFLDHPTYQFIFFAIIATIPFWRFRQLGNLFFLKVDWLLTATLVGIVLLGALVQRLPVDRIRSNIWPPLLLFYTFNVLVSLRSPFPDFAFSGLGVLTLVLAFITINIIMLNNRGVAVILPWVIGLSIAANVILALLGTTLGVAAFRNTSGELFGATIGANNMAVMSVFSFPIMVHLVINATSPAKRLIAIVVTVLLVAGVVLSGSRGGFLAFTVSALFVAFHYRVRFNPRFLGIVLAGFGVIALAVIAFVPQDYIERQASLAQLTNLLSVADPDQITDTSLDRRTSYVQVAIKAFIERPMLGWGTDTFRELWFLSEVSDEFKNVRRPAHNTYLEVLVGSGLLGLAIFLWLLTRTYRNYLRAERELATIGDRRGVDLAASYRIAMIAILFYFFVKSGIDHKLFLLSIPLSSAMLKYAASKRSEQQSSHHTEYQANQSRLGLSTATS